MSIACPFTILVDHREKLPFSFAGLATDTSDRRGANVPLAVTVERAHLDAGDYAVRELQGSPQAVAVERKSLTDLYGTLGQARARFQRELVRLSQLRYAAVVVEADWPTVLLAPPPRSQLVPKTVFRSVVAWEQRYPTVHWWFAAGRAFAEVVTFRVLERAWKDSQTRRRGSAGGANRGGTRTVVMQ